MAKPTKKILPKDFEDQLKSGDVEKLKAVFETCLLDARGGYSKQTALAFNDCPDELARWMIAQGASVDEPDSYGDTPLHSRTAHWQGNITILLELGANIEATNRRLETPLHKAASVGNARNVELLLTHGANPDARNADGLTPLALALQRCHNAKIVEMAQVAEVLFPTRTQLAPSKPSFLSSLFGKREPDEDLEMSALKASVVEIGTQFEFHRKGYNPESVDQASAALDKLYQLFDVPPVPRRILHDGRSPIIAKSASWEDAHQELWELLVPSSGAADTVQGEIVRLSGRIHDEICHNGGANWDADYRKMASSLISLLESNCALPAESLSDARQVISTLSTSAGDTRELCRMAVEWVRLNPSPLPLPKPGYRR